MPYSDHFGPLLSLRDGQGDRRQALDAIGLSHVRGEITLSQAVQFRDLVNSGEATSVLAYLEPLPQEPERLAA